MSLRMVTSLRISILPFTFFNFFQWICQSPCSLFSLLSAFANQVGFLFLKKQQVLKKFKLFNKYVSTSYSYFIRKSILFPYVKPTLVTLPKIITDNSNPEVTLKLNSPKPQNQFSELIMQKLPRSHTAMRSRDYRILISLQ